MTERQALEAIAEQFASTWPAASGNVTYVLENNALPTTLDTFAHLTADIPLSDQLTMGTPGTRRGEHRGTIFVKLWTPANGGRGPSADLCDAARTCLQGKSLAVGSDSLVIFAGATKRVGVDGRWYMAVVTLPFVYYDTL